MSAKRFSVRLMMIVLLAISLVGGGCATTSSQTGTAPKPHKPQMITGDEDKEGVKLPDSVAGVLGFFGQLFGASFDSH